MKAPATLLPPLSCETHSHVYGDARRYPVAQGRQAVARATLRDYLDRAEPLGVQRHVLVQASAYGADPRCLLDAITELGLQRARGVIIADPEHGALDLARLHEQGIRGVRYLFPPGAAVDVAAISETAHRIAELGWSLIVQGDACALTPCLARLSRLPVPVVIDHLARLGPASPIGSPEFSSVLSFLNDGGWIKISAPYYGTRGGVPDFRLLEDRVRAFLDAAPDRSIWGMNWPHPSLDEGRKPDDRETLQGLVQILDTDAEARALFVRNPARLYGFPD